MSKISNIKYQKLKKNYSKKLEVTPPSPPLSGGEYSVAISAIVIVNPRWGHDIELLPGCLESLKFVDEVVLVTSEVTKEFKAQSSKFKAKVVTQKGGNFAEWRDQGAEEARGEWLLYVDADERVTDELRKEIVLKIKEQRTNSNTPSSSPLARGRTTLEDSKSFAGYAIPRSNRILGREMRHGGWWPDYVLRLMKRDKLLGYEGDLHEQPKLDGSTGYLKNHFIHLKFDRLEEYVEKTNAWSDKEADLLMNANHPKLNTMRFWRLSVNPFLISFLDRYAVKRGFLDGTEGLIDAIYQSYSQFLSFAKLYEKQVSDPNLRITSE